MIPESTLSILILDRDNSFVTSMLLKLWCSCTLRRLMLLLPGLLGVSRRRVFSYRRRQMAIKGTARRRQTMAITMPMIAPGLKPSLRELALGIMAGGASGVKVGVGAGAILFIW